jgi:hypothetical protein
VLDGHYTDTWNNGREKVEILIDRQCGWEKKDHWLFGFGT